MRRVLNATLSLALFSVSLTTTAFANDSLPTYIVPYSETNMPRIGEEFEVLGRRAEGFEVVVPLEQQKKFLNLVPEARYSRDLHAGFQNLKSLNGIYSAASLEQRLKDLQKAYPQYLKLETYGTSKEGRPEYVLTMEKQESAQGSKPALMITSATHGDEVITVEVTLGLIERMLKAGQEDARMAKLLDQLKIYWVPAVCVDGYAHRSRTVEGLDPNRDYAWPEKPTREPKTKCIQHMVQFFNDHTDIVGTMDFHAAGSMIMFPWAYTYDHIDAKSYQIHDELTTRMAEKNEFEHGPISEVIYVAKGSSADYYFWKRQTVSVAIEVSHNFAPRFSEIQEIIEENAESTWRFLEHFLK